MSEKLPKTRRTLLELYLDFDPTQLPDRVQGEIDAGTREDPMWVAGAPTGGLSFEDILHAPQDEVDELTAYLDSNDKLLYFN